jgi:hypothetical protein
MYPLGYRPSPLNLMKTKNTSSSSRNSTTDASAAARAASFPFCPSEKVASVAVARMAIRLLPGRKLAFVNSSVRTKLTAPVTSVVPPIGARPRTCSENIVLLLAAATVIFRTGPIVKKPFSKSDGPANSRKPMRVPSWDSGWDMAKSLINSCKSTKFPFSKAIPFEPSISHIISTGENRKQVGDVVGNKVGEGVAGEADGETVGDEVDGEADGIEVVGDIVGDTVG